MNARNRRRLEALEQQMAAPKGHGWPLIVDWYGKGGPNAWAVINGERMTPQEVSKFYRRRRLEARRAGKDAPRYLEVYLSDESDEELQAALDADNADDD